MQAVTSWSREMIKARSDWWKGVDGSIMKCKKALHERLFAITRAMREAPGGEIACCGSFLPKFVASLQQNPSKLSDREAKLVLRILKAVSGCPEGLGGAPTRPLWHQLEAAGHYAILQAFFEDCQNED